MARRLRSYLRTRRLEAGLSQSDLGALIGLHRDSISDYEREKYPIPARLIIAGEILFGQRAHELFPAVYRAVHDEIRANALILHEALRHHQDARSARKRRALDRIPTNTQSIDL